MNCCRSQTITGNNVRQFLFMTIILKMFQKGEHFVSASICWNFSGNPTQHVINRNPLFITQSETASFVLFKLSCKSHMRNHYSPLSPNFWSEMLSGVCNKREIIWYEIIMVFMLTDVTIPFCGANRLFWSSQNMFSWCLIVAGRKIPHFSYMCHTFLTQIPLCTNFSTNFANLQPHQNSLGGSSNIVTFPPHGIKECNNDV